MTSVLIRDTQKRGEGNVTVEATGMIQPQLQEYWQPKLEEARKGISPSISGGGMAVVTR